MKWLPAYDKNVILFMKNGDIRHAYYHGTGCFRLTDGSHPLQNCHLFYGDVNSWTYEDESEFDNDNAVSINLWQRRLEAEDILKQVKIKISLLPRIKKFFKRQNN